MAKKIETVWRTNQTKATRVGYIYKICHDSRKRDGGGGGGERNAVRFKLLQSKPKEGMKRIWDFPEM